MPLGDQKSPKRPVRVLVVTQVLTPYRLPLFRRLALLPDWDLLVAHGLYTPIAGFALVDRNATPSFATQLVRNLVGRCGTLTVRWQAGVLGAARRFRPDVVILTGEVGTLSSWAVSVWARLTGRRVIAWTSAWEPQKRGSIGFAMKRVAWRVYIRIPHTTLTYSTRAKRVLIDLGASEDRIVVCQNGIEVANRLERGAEIRAGAARLRAAEASGARVLFLYVGRIADDKGLDLLLQAFAQVQKERGCALWLVGDGPCLEKLRKLVVKLELENVTFWGRVVDDADRFFAAADFFVLPSVGGMALNQAMLFGVPCVCSVADGTEDDLVIHEQTGLRFTPNDLASLVTVMRRAADIGRSGEFVAMGAAARNLVLTIGTVDAMVETLTAVVRREPAIC